MRLKLKLGDILIIAVILISAIIMTISLYKKDEAEKVAIVSQNNIVIEKIYLNQHAEPYTFTYSGKYPGIIEAQGGRIRFSHAECPDQVCVNTGWIQRPGQIAVCLPAGVIIKIEGSEQSDIDILVK